MIFALSGCAGADDADTPTPAAHSSKGTKTANSATEDVLSHVSGTATPDQAQPPAESDPAANGGDVGNADEQQTEPSDPAAPSGDNPADVPPAQPAEEDPTPATAAVPSYQVPVSTDLVAFSRYRIESVQWRVDDGGEVRLAYALPVDLTGKSQRLDFSGVMTSETTWSLEGKDFGTAECSQTGADIMCVEHLDGVEVDVAAVKKLVDAGKLAPQRLDVTKAFDADPIGILRFPAP